jgi:hypothetical protein
MLVVASRITASSTDGAERYRHEWTLAEEGRHRPHATWALPGDAPAMAVAEGACEGALGVGLGVSPVRCGAAARGSGRTAREMGGGGELDQGLVREAARSEGNNISVFL